MRMSASIGERTATGSPPQQAVETGGQAHSPAQRLWRVSASRYWQCSACGALGHARAA